MNNTLFVEGFLTQKHGPTKKLSLTNAAKTEVVSKRLLWKDVKVLHNKVCVSTWDLNTTQLNTGILIKKTTSIKPPGSSRGA